MQHQHIRNILLGLTLALAVTAEDPGHTADTEIDTFVNSLGTCADTCRPFAQKIQACVHHDKEPPKAPSNDVITQYSQSLASCFCQTETHNELNKCEKCLSDNHVWQSFDDKALTDACASGDTSKVLKAAATIVPTPETAVFANSSGYFAPQYDLGKFENGSGSTMSYVWTGWAVMVAGSLFLMI